MTPDDDPVAERHPSDPLPTARPATAAVPWTVADTLGVFAAALFATVAALALVVALLRAVAPAVPLEAATLPVSLLVLGLSAPAWVRVRYPGAERRLAGTARARWGDAGAGLGAGVGAFLVITLGVGTLLSMLARAAGFELPVVQEDFRRLAMDAASAPLFLFSAVVVAPVAEEVFFRGMLFQALRRRTGMWTAAAVSGLAFALAHAQQSTAAGNALVILVIFPLGVLLAVLFARRGTIVAPIVAHATYNLVQVLVLLLAPETLV